MICDAAAVSLQMSPKKKDKPDKNEINNIVSLTLSICYCFGILTSAMFSAFRGQFSCTRALSTITTKTPKPLQCASKL